MSAFETLRRQARSVRRLAPGSLGGRSEQAQPPPHRPKAEAYRPSVGGSYTPLMPWGPVGPSVFYPPPTFEDHQWHAFYSDDAAALAGSGVAFDFGIGDGGEDYYYIGMAWYLDTYGPEDHLAFMLLTPEDALVQLSPNAAAGFGQWVWSAGGGPDDFNQGAGMTFYGPVVNDASTQVGWGIKGDIGAAAGVSVTIPVVGSRGVGASVYEDNDPYGSISYIDIDPTDDFWIVDDPDDDAYPLYGYSSGHGWRIYARQNGSDKTELCVQFGIQVDFGSTDPIILATEP